MCLKSMLHIYSKEELFMFTENIIVSSITAYVKNFISVSVRDKKKFDKTIHREDGRSKAPAVFFKALC